MCLTARGNEQHRSECVAHIEPEMAAAVRISRGYGLGVALASQII
jgi:hypothetical protein